PINQVQQGAEIMYYGGDIAELLLATTLITTWRPERRTKTATTTRNPATSTPAPQ
ncbi:cytochrome c oxidase assembly protein, partial [Streptomyces sp. NPDC101149]